MLAGALVLHFVRKRSDFALNWIALLGNDESLLESRRMLLTHLGYKVNTFLGMAAFRVVPIDAPLIVAILCHSLRTAEQEDAAAIVRRHWPGAELMVLTRDYEAARLPAPLTVAVGYNPLSFILHVQTVTDRWRSQGYAC